MQKSDHSSQSRTRSSSRYGQSIRLSPNSSRPTDLFFSSTCALSLHRLGLEREKYSPGLFFPRNAATWWLTISLPLSPCREENGNGNFLSMRLSASSVACCPRFHVGLRTVHWV